MKSLLDALRDPKLLGEHFSPWSDWANWSVVLSAILGEELDTKGRALFKKLFGFTYTVGHPASESLILAGRGSGKSKIAAAIVVCVATLRDWSHLKRRARVLLLSVDREQSEECFGFIEQFFHAPVLAAMIVSRTKRSLTLKNGIIIQVRTASARGLRGPSVVAAIMDEASYLNREPSANSDLKIYRALRPALSKVAGSMLISISSTGERSGVAYEMFSKFYGKPNSPVLVCLAKSTDLNTTKDHARARAAAFALDEYSARAEYDSLFFDDESAFISKDRVHVIDAVNPQPPARGRLFCGLDTSGGAVKGDCYAMAVSWVVDARIGLGMLEARPGRRDPVETSTEFATMLKGYGSRLTIISDAYAGNFVPALFRRHGLQIFPPHKKSLLEGSGRLNQSDYFISLLGRMHVIDWPSHPQLLKELYDLVRTPDGCEHASGKHDDLIGAAARAIFSAGMWLDANAVYESPPEQEEEPEPNEAAERALYHGDTRAEWHRRGRGSVLKGEPDPDLVPKPGSLAERIERSRSNDRDGVLVRF